MTTTISDSVAHPEEAEPRIPHPLELELSDEEVRRFQALIQKPGHPDVSLEEARAAALEMLRLFLLLLAPKRYEALMKEAPVINRHFVTPPSPAPSVYAVPLPLDGDHREAIEQNLQQIQSQMRFVGRRPTAWRWVVLATWNALAHALAIERPIGYLPRPGTDQLPQLFRAVCTVRPELPQVGRAIEALNEIRTGHFARGVTRWPVNLKTELPGIVEDRLRVVRRMCPGRL